MKHCKVFKFVREAVLVANKDIGVEVSAEKTKHKLLSCERNSGQNHGMYVGNISFKSEAKLKYLGTVPLKQNRLQEESTNRYKSSKTC
jgi:hypothetical protein